MSSKKSSRWFLLLVVGLLWSVPSLPTAEAQKPAKSTKVRPAAKKAKAQKAATKGGKTVKAAKGKGVKPTGNALARKSKSTVPAVSTAAKTRASKTTKAKTTSTKAKTKTASAKKVKAPAKAAKARTAKNQKAKRTAPKAKQKQQSSRQNSRQRQARQQQAEMEMQMERQVRGELGMMARLKARTIQMRTFAVALVAGFGGGVIGKAIEFVTGSAPGFAEPGSLMQAPGVANPAMEFFGSGHFVMGAVVGLGTALVAGTVWAAQTRRQARNIESGKTDLATVNPAKFQMGRGGGGGANPFVPEIGAPESFVGRGGMIGSMGN